MPGRVNSTAPMILGVVLVSLATVAINFDNAVRADNACIEQPPLPVAERPYVIVPFDFAACHSCHALTAEDLHWTVRYDRAKGRKCWFLLDAYGHDVTETHVRPAAAPTSTSTFSSKLASLFDNFSFLRTSAKVTPESSAPPVSPPNPTRKQRGDTANANRTYSGARIGQRSNEEGHAIKRVSQALNRTEDRVLFEEFLQWRERQKVINALGPPSTRQ